MDRLEHEGQIYYRIRSKWTDDRHIFVCQNMQKKLNKAHIASLDLSVFSVEDLVVEGDKFKQSDSFDYAIAFYERALEECDGITMKYILPRITSCFRQNNQPKKVVELFSMIKGKFGESFITPVLLTSVAAAYCDLGEYENALRCCRWAFKRSKGGIDPNLKNVWARLQKEMGAEL
jgi:tetratricopeptide (TPR) repeat protein